MRYHLNSKGDVTPCRAKTPDSCPLQSTTPPQFYAATRHEMYDYIKEYYGPCLASLKAKKPLRVAQDQLGTPETDKDRVVVNSTRNRNWTSSHYWLKDIEGNPMGFINVNLAGNSTLSSIEKGELATAKHAYAKGQDSQSSKAEKEKAMSTVAKMLNEIIGIIIRKEAQLQINSWITENIAITKGF